MAQPGPLFRTLKKMRDPRPTAKARPYFYVGRNYIRSHLRGKVLYDKKDTSLFQNDTICIRSTELNTLKWSTTGNPIDLAVP